MSSIKMGRINSELVKTISEILLNETRDELMKTITITSASCSKDLSFAKIYFTSLSEKSHKDLEKEMAEAEAFIRKNVAEKLDMRQTPKLQFIYDESIEYGNKIEKIIAELHREDEKE